MTGVARAAPPFLHGVDSLAPVTDAVARAFWADGIRFWGRYLENLTLAERDVLFNVGFAILPITEATTSVTLAADLGASRGAQSVRRAAALGCPPSVHVTIDLESTTGDAAAVTAFADAFHGALASGGYDSMAYIGAGQPLDAAQIYGLKSTRYWRSISYVPEPQCGWSCIQLRPGDQVVHGQRVDYDTVESDFRGRTPVLWWPS